MMTPLPTLPRTWRRPLRQALAVAWQAALVVGAVALILWLNRG